MTNILLFLIALQLWFGWSAKDLWGKISKAGKAVKDSIKDD